MLAGHGFDDAFLRGMAVLIGASGAVPVTEAGTIGVASDVLVARFTTQSATGAPADITAGVAEIFLSVVDLDDIL